MEIGISNLSVYNDAMKKALMDKAFFLDKIDAHVLVDFGCADGALLNYVHQQFPNLHLIGYDLSAKQAALASANVPAGKFYHSWKEVEDILPLHLGKKALILSSVLHEVLSYSKEEEIVEFWNRVFNTGFDYIVIRDMCVSASASRPSKLADVAKVFALANSEMLNDFQRTWGSITDNKNLIHFLMKYRYVTNWSREVQENYLPVTFEELSSHISVSGYRIKYIDHYLLPFLEETVKKDFDIELKDHSHVKIILQRT